VADVAAAVERIRARYMAKTLVTGAPLPDDLIVCDALGQSQDKANYYQMALEERTEQFAEAQREIARLQSIIEAGWQLSQGSREVMDSLSDAQALARTLARALEDADGSLDAERRRQKVLANPRVQALLKE